jgi:hypothetical protein
MSRARHKEKKADGGRVGMKVSGNPDVFEEAAEKHKKGGRVKKEMHADGEKSKHRMDRPKRASGGRVGSDQSPFSSARKAGGGKEPNPNG